MDDVISTPGGDAQPEALGVLLVSVAARLSRLYGRVLGQLDTPLTFRQHRLLRRVHEGNTSLASLAAYGNLSIPTVSESIDLLVRRGLMDRRENPRNRRSMLLRLTPKGMDVKEAGDEVLDAVGDRLLSSVPAEHQPILHSSLTAIFDAATEMFQQPEPDAVAEVTSARSTKS